MYNTYDKSNEFYLYIVSQGKTYFIGNEEELIMELAKYFRRSDLCFLKNETYLENIYFDNINMNGNDTKYIGIFNNEYCIRKYLFFDGNGKIVDIRKYKEKAIELCAENGYLNSYFLIPFYKKKEKKKKQCRIRHCATCYHHKPRKTKRTQTYNSDAEHKVFVRDRDKHFPKWYDDSTRRISCNWKDQTKDKKQWEHKVKMQEKKVD